MSLETELSDGSSAPIKTAFIIGAPRSGTTFFTTAVNRHPQIFITNEMRVFSLFAAISKMTEDPSEVFPEHPLRDQFNSYLGKGLSKLYLDFMLKNVNKTNLGVPTASEQHYFRRIKVFGDKNPDYSAPANRRSLSIILEAFPSAKFFHVHRDPRSCCLSYLRTKVYPNNLRDVVPLWRNYVQSSLSFLDELPSEQRMHVKFEDLVTDKGLSIADEIIDFLKIDKSKAMNKFLSNEQEKRTPFRSPSSAPDAIGKTVFRDYLSDDECAYIEGECAPLMERLGYDLQSK